MATLVLAAACGTSSEPSAGNVPGAPQGGARATEALTAANDVCGTTDEGGQIDLACPAGTVITGVTFASYGTPNGSCGGFTTDSCNASTSASVVSTACVGKGSCTVAANNDTFGDPCVLTFKRLFAEVTCGAATTTAAAVAPPVQAAAVAPPVQAAAVAPAGQPVPHAFPGGMKVGTNFWHLDWGIWDDVFAAGAAFTAGAAPWKPAFLQEVSPYAAIRFMDFGWTNDSTQRTWADRTPPDAPADQQTRLAYEWMIDLCNRLGRDMWVTVPAMANDDYGFQLATLINRSLRPDLKVYVEWSNETWNGIFSQTQYAYDQGNALGLDSDPWTAAFKYHVYAAVRLFHQFDRVFGVGSARVVKVLAGQSSNTWITGVHLAALKDPTINPDGVTADAYAIAPYFGHDVDGNAGDAPDRLRQSMQAAVEEVKQQSAIVSAAGLSLVAYEGGQHVLSGADVVNKRPEMYQIYQEYLDAISPYFKVFMHYVHNGNWSSGGAWGAEQFVGEPLTEAPKLRAIFDWIKSHL